MSQKPRLCFIGQMLGRNPGYVTTQGQIAADLFSQDGYQVISASSKTNRISRMVDIIATVIRNRQSVDLVVVEVYSGMSFAVADAASLLARNLGLPSIGVLHGGDLGNFCQRFPRWTERVLRRFDRVSAPSGFLADLIGAKGIPVKTIPNVLDIDKYPFRERSFLEPRLLWMRAFHGIYQPELALTVFSIIRTRFPTATLIMAGPDKGLASVTVNTARELGLGESISFPGYLDQRAKMSAFTNADIFLNTNRIDNMPVAVLEACAMGLPVVATNVGGLPYLLKDGESGLLVSNGHATGIADAVVRLLSEPGLANRLSKNGRKLAEKSSWRSVKQQWESLFEEVLTAQ